ncbi:MAG: PIN domain-containing protein [Chloroflexota bacterium]
MISVDTSVVVRYLVGTPAAEAKRASALMDGSVEIGVPLVALMETAHVLRTQYGVERADLVNVLIELLTRHNVTTLGLPTSDALVALVNARSLPGSPIPDAFIAATASWAGALPLYTFDDDLHKHGVAVETP